MRKAFLLSLCWAILPAVPALIQNELIGSPYTDLYPSVWSLYAPWMSSKGFFYTTMLGYPEGMPLYSSALLKSFLALPLSLLLEPHHIYNFFILLSRFLGPFFAFFAARAWGYKETASLGFALFFGAAPYFHGYAVEGIIEGVDAWPLALWLWSVASGKRLLMALSLALSVLCSWYLGASVCLLTLLFSIEKRDTLFSFFGLLLAAPFIYVFTQNFPSMGGIPADVRAQLCMDIGIPQPNILSDTNPFAKTNYIGWLAGGLALFSRSRYLLYALLPLSLSLGIGMDLFGLSYIRFPYRWHGATLVLLGFALAETIEKYPRWWLIPLIVLEGLLLSPIDAILPTSSSQAPTVYHSLQQPVLDVPGPLSLPAGTPNRSRARASYLLYAQLKHRQPSVWSHDFNLLHTTEDSRWERWRSWDPLLKKTPLPPSKEDVQYLQRNSISVVIHKLVIGRTRARQLQRILDDHGWTPRIDSDTHLLYQSE